MSTQTVSPADLSVVNRMSKDLRAASVTLSKDEARFLVDSYYNAQEARIRADGQIRSMSETGEPHTVLDWLSIQNSTLEGQVKGALERYVKSQRVGEWMLGITGIGPVIAAGLLAHLDVEKAPTAGHFWAFAGYDPTKTWEKGQRRPWNAELKRICFLAGESFVKVQGNEKDVYGKMFVKAKSREWGRNIRGELAEQAERELAKKRIGRDTVAYSFYAGLASPSEVLEMIQGRGVPATYRGGKNVGDEVRMLPPAHIHARARRIVVKLFLSHVHEVMYRDFFDEAPPKPFVIDQLRHAHYFAVPNRWW